MGAPEFNPMEIDLSLAKRIAAARRLVALTGAGVSAESGLPTFRGAGGQWNNMRPEQLATAEGFRADPKMVWSWYQHRRRAYRLAAPNAGHLALAELGTILPSVTIATQNVDRLHQRAGSRQVIELHGNVVENHCMRCNEPAGEVSLESDELQACRHCGGWLRPSVVWFGEMLPVEALESASEAAAAADVFLSIGTSAQVYPAAQLPALAQHNGALLIEINPEPTPLSHLAEAVFRAPSAQVLPALVKAIRQVS